MEFVEGIWLFFFKSILDFFFNYYILLFFLYYFCFNFLIFLQAINFSVFDLLVSSGETFDKVVHMRQKKFEKANLPCLECQDNIVFEENVLGLESREMNMKRRVFQMIGGDAQESLAKVGKVSGLFCSVCASSQKFKDSGIFGKFSVNRFMKNRIFLRFLTGN